MMNKNGLRYISNGGLRRAETLDRSSVEGIAPRERPFEIGHVRRFVLGIEHA